MSAFEIKNGKSERTEDDWGDNGTDQGEHEGVEFCVRTFVNVPDVFLSDPHSIDQAEGIIVDALRKASKKAPELSFIVTVRHGEGVDPDELVPW